MTLKVPSPKLEPAKALRLISLQNSGLETKNWIVHKAENLEGNSTLLVLGVDVNSANVLKARNYRVHLEDSTSKIISSPYPKPSTSKVISSTVPKPSTSKIIVLQNVTIPRNDSNLHSNSCSTENIPYTERELETENYEHDSLGEHFLQGVSLIPQQSNESSPPANPSKSKWSSFKYSRAERNRRARERSQKNQTPITNFFEKFNELCDIIKKVPEHKRLYKDDILQDINNLDIKKCVENALADAINETEEVGLLANRNDIFVDLPFKSAEEPSEEPTHIDPEFESENELFADDSIIE
ncbi:unnamed protein product [Brassicogethes aeneus]|uniref:DUF4780 domain-containing protein n=1 Tax=Brassicogethes aeneus TaxID=1431903 RepID=A0A9P0FI18_BRAAE|nr:unnamed protein product [Brassicogethes aeneus]